MNIYTHRTVTDSCSNAWNQQSVMVYGLNTQAHTTFWLTFKEKFLIIFFCQHWTSSWSWLGCANHQKEEGLHSLQRLCVNMAAKGQSGWKLWDYNDSKYVLWDGGSLLQIWPFVLIIYRCIPTNAHNLHVFSYFSCCCELQWDSEHVALCKSGKKHCELPHSQRGPRWEADQRAEGGGCQASKAAGGSQSGLEKHGK